MAGLALVLGLALAVLRQRAADVDDLVEPALLVAADKALVRPGINQLALALWHLRGLQLGLKRRTGSARPGSAGAGVAALDSGRPDQRHLRRRVGRQVARQARV